MKNFRYTIVMPPRKGQDETKQTNSERVVMSALKNRWLVIDNASGLEVL